LSEYVVIERTPTVTEYRELRRLVGLSAKTEEAAVAGLPNTRFAVVVEFAGEAIGMGRVIGDGGTAFQITDIAVLPAHQKRGLGKRIVEALVEWLRANAPKSAYISLIADGPAKDLYAQYGFKPTEEHGSIGMYIWIT
jgi:ribosomal protein S18 acetylase RimI-like enzyme